MNNFPMSQSSGAMDPATQAQAQAAYYYSQQMQQYYQQQAAAAAAAVQQAQGQATPAQNPGQGQPQPAGGAQQTHETQVANQNPNPYQAYAAYFAQQSGSAPGAAPYGATQTAGSYVPAAPAVSYGPGQTAPAYVPPHQQQAGQPGQVTPQTAQAPPVFNAQQPPPSVQGTPQQQQQQQAASSVEEWTKWAAAYAQHQASAMAAYSQQMLSSYGQMQQQPPMVQQTGHSYDPSMYQYFDQSATAAADPTSATISGAPQVYQNFATSQSQTGVQTPSGAGLGASGTSPRQIGPQIPTPTKSTVNIKPQGARPTTPTTGTRPQTRPMGGRGRGGYPLLGGRPSFQSMGMSGSGAGTGVFPRPRGGSFTSPGATFVSGGYQYAGGYGYEVMSPYMGPRGPRPKRGGPNIYGPRNPFSEDGGPAPSDMFFPYYGIAELPSHEEEEPDPKKMKVEETKIGDWKPVEKLENDKNGDAQIGHGFYEDDGKDEPIVIPEEMLQPDFCKLCCQKLDEDQSSAHYDSGDHLIKSNEYVQRVREERAQHRRAMEAAGVWQPPIKKRQYSFINKKFKFTCFLCKMFFETQEAVNSHVTEETHRKKVTDSQNASIFSGPHPGGKARGGKAHGPKPPQLKLTRGANIEDLYCEICNKIMNSSNQLEEHLNSKKHKDKEQHSSGGQKMAKNETPLQKQVQHVEFPLAAGLEKQVSKIDQSKTSEGNAEKATGQSATAEGGAKLKADK